MIQNHQYHCQFFIKKVLKKCASKYALSKKKGLSNTSTTFFKFEFDFGQMKRFLTLVTLNSACLYRLASIEKINLEFMENMKIVPNRTLKNAQKTWVLFF